MARTFWFREFDVKNRLPVDWDGHILSIVAQCAVEKLLVSSSVTSRELTQSKMIRVQTVGGRTVVARLPWLYDLYRGQFRDIAQSISDEPVYTAEDVRYAVNLNVQTGPHMRYECHVDSNPIEGLLYITTHAPGDGGELVVANRPDALGVEAISSDCTRIYPERGKLVFFDATSHPHFVAPLKSGSQRVVVAMNFYTPSRPESSRPADLNRHLGIE